MQSTRILWSPLALLNILFHIHCCATLSTICCIGIFNRMMSRHICMPCRCCNTTQVLKFLIKLTIIWTGFWLAKIQSKHITSQEEYNITLLSKHLLVPLYFLIQFYISFGDNHQPAQAAKTPKSYEFDHYYLFVYAKHIILLPPTVLPHQDLGLQV